MAADITENLTELCGFPCLFGSQHKILNYENEDDIGNLYIREDDSLLDNVRFYTDKEFIYEVLCSIDKKRAKQLLDYIKDIELISPIEVYSIWLDDRIDLDFKLLEVFFQN